MLDAADVDPDEERYFALAASQVSDLLNITEVKSMDYNTQNALVEGRINTFLGFRFVRTQRITISGTTRTCLAWAKSGMLLAKRTEMIAKLDVIPTKHYATQAYASVSSGATRMEEAKCVEVACLES